MKHSLENISDVEKRITIEIPKEKIKEEIENTYGYLAKNAQIKGFRKGKVPRNIIEMHFKDQVLSDVMSKLINESYSKALKENNLSPVSYPKFDAEKLDTNKDYSYKATVEVKPTLNIENYTGMELTKEKIEITEKDVETVLNHLRENQSILKLKDTEALKKGDFAVAEIVASLDGKQLTPDKSRTQTVEIGKKLVHPKIEEALLKLKKGEDTRIKTKLDEKIRDKKLAGKETEFYIKLKEIREKISPQINDDFARSLGPHKDLKDLKEALKDEIKAERERKADLKLQSDALQKITAQNSFEVPKTLIDNETAYIVNDFKGRAARQGLTAKALEEQTDKMREEFKKEALQRVKESLVLETIARKESITATENDVSQRIEAIAKNLGVEPQKVREYYTRDNALENLKVQITVEKTLDFIIKKANIKTDSPKTQKESGV